MTEGFVFGKFLPFHKGHEAMIRFALQHCDILHVLVCCSDKEAIAGNIRKSWIDQTFQDNSIHAVVYNYQENVLPNTSVSSMEVSRQWAEVFKLILPKCTVLITSEKYGDYVAEIMNIKHVAFDTLRNTISVSSTMIRNNLRENWFLLPDAVRKSLVRKVILTGTESTGKTSMTLQLAKEFSALAVMEKAREVIAHSSSFGMEDLERVAIGHAEDISKACDGSNPLVIIDTDVHITRSYSRFFFGKELVLSPSIIKENKSDLYLYLNNDAPYFQDGTRLNEPTRNLLDSCHRKVYVEEGIQLIEISGNWEDRLKDARIAVEKIIRIF